MRTLAAVAPGTRVVDLAAGAGRHLVPLTQLGLDVHGVTHDVEGAHVALARVLGDVEARRRIWAAASIASGLPDQSADWVVLTEVGHHRASALAEAFRLLVPGGWVWVETTTTDHLDEDAEAAGLVPSEPVAKDGKVFHAIFRRPGGVG